MNVDLGKLEKEDICEEMNALFVCSGNDIVSFFKHKTKHAFMCAYMENIDFVSASDKYSGCLSHCAPNTWELGFMAFLRLIVCVFLKKCANYFVRLLKCRKNPTGKRAKGYMQTGQWPVSSVPAIGQYDKGIPVSTMQYHTAGRWYLCST